MNDKKISVVIPAYKDEYLGRCIDSVLGQTYPNFELVVVNDASPYPVGDVVARYEDARIRYFENEENIGEVELVRNWNKCLAYCTGDYVICMGDDDKLLPDCLKYYMALIQKYPQCKVYHMQSQIIDEKDEIMDIQSARPEFETVYSFMWHEVKEYRKQFIGDFMFDTEYLRSLGGFYYLPCAWHSDRISVMRAAEKYGIANCPEYGFQYRKNRSSISSGGSHKRKCDAWLMADEWYREFLGTRPEDEKDGLYYDGVVRFWPDFRQKNIMESVLSDMRAKPFRFIFWWKKRKTYHYSGLQLFKLFCHAVIGHLGLGS